MTFGGTHMSIRDLAILAALCAGVLAPGVAGAAAARPAPKAAAPAAAPPAYTVKLTNGGTQAVTAVYASPTGKNDWGDDLLGRQTAGAGRTVTLGFKQMPPELCMQDLQLLLNDGQTVTKAGVDVCQTTDYRFAP